MLLLVGVIFCSTWMKTTDGAAVSATSMKAEFSCRAISTAALAARVCGTATTIAAAAMAAESQVLALREFRMVIVVGWNAMDPKLFKTGAAATGGK